MPSRFVDALGHTGSGEQSSYTSHSSTTTLPRPGSSTISQETIDFIDADDATADHPHHHCHPRPVYPSSPQDTIFKEKQGECYFKTAERELDATQREAKSGSGSGSLRSTTTTALDDGSDNSFPEGGLEAWLVVLGSFCAVTAVFGLSNSAGVFADYLASNQLVAYTKFQIGWIFSLNLFLVFFVGIQVGPVFDRYGPRVLVILGSFCSCSSLFLFSLSTSMHPIIPTMAEPHFLTLSLTAYYQILLSYSVLGGLGGALLHTPSYGVIAHFFNRRRGLATGIATTSGGIGGVVFPLILRRLLPLVGFSWSARVLGFILLALAVPANLFIRARLPPKVSGSKERIELALAIGSPNSDNTSSRSSFRSVLPDLRVFCEPPFALASAGCVFMECGLFVPLTYIVSFAASSTSTSPESAYLLLSYLNAGSVLGRVLPGFLSDRLGRFNVIVATIALCVTAVLGLWLPASLSTLLSPSSPTSPSLVAFAVIFGFASGSNLGLIPVCLGQLCDAREFGRYLSTAMMVASFGTLCSVPIAGALQETKMGWVGLILFSGLAYAAALACYIAARVKAVGWRVGVRF